MNNTLRWGSNQLKILVLDINKSTFDLIKIHLKDLNYKCEFEIAERIAEFTPLVKSFLPDVVLCDFNPSVVGHSALEILRKHSAHTPFIYVSNILGEENAVEAIRSGATDFISTKRLEHLPAAIVRSLREKNTKYTAEKLFRQQEINASFVSGLLQHDDWKGALYDTFPMIGEILNVDEVYYCEKEFGKEKGEEFEDNILKWSSCNIGYQLNTDNRQKLAFQEFKYFMDPLSNNRAFQAIISELPEGVLKEDLAARGILSFIVAPIFLGENFYGFIGVNDYTKTRQWKADDVAFLEKLSINIATAMELSNARPGLIKIKPTINTTIRNFPVIAYRCLPDKKWTMQFVSDEIERITGYPATDFIDNKKRTYASIIHPDDLHKTCVILDRPNALEEFTLEYRLICFDGSLRWIEERGHGIYDANHRLQFIDGVIMDVTEKKKANDKFQAIFDQTTEAILLADDQGNYIDFNKAAINLFGYKRHELSGMNVAQVMGVPFDDDFIGSWNRFLQTGQEKGTIQLPTKNGSLIHASYNAVASILPGVHLSMISNITEKVQNEEQLLASERKFKALVQEGSDLLSILDMDANYLFVSESSTIAVLGFSPQDLVGRNAFEFIHPDDKERVMKQFSTLKDSKQISISPFRYRDANNEWHIMATTATNLMDDPAVRGIVANSRDVTDSIEQREALKISNERFEIAMKATNEMIWDWDLKTDRVTRSSAFENILGFQKTTSNAYSEFWLDSIHDDDVLTTRKSLRTALENTKQEKWENEYRIVKSDGNIAYIVDRGHIIRDGNGKAIRVVGAASDVTASREMLNEISQQNNVLKEIAWTQSHIVRAPLARLQGLVELLETEDFDLPTQKDIIKKISKSAAELDTIIRDIVNKADQLER